ncbi:MAG: hypothetical protein WB473_13055, partial [Pedococcus sp.]
MAIFRRGKKSEQTDELDPTLDRTGLDEPSADAADAADPSADPEGGDLPSGEPAATQAAPLDREGNGPHDSSEVDLSDDGRLDLGALRIRG